MGKEVFNMQNLTEPQAKSVAAEWTRLAIENNLITKQTSAKRTAEDVFEFYKTLYEKLASKED